MSTLTAWIKPPEKIKGRDHLGVRVPSETLYGKLIPGITNVTNRARYYSFYPWLIWAIKERYASLSQSEFIETLRRADCLFTLIGAWHSQHSIKPGRDWQHGGELVGRDVLLRVLKELEGEKTHRLSHYTRLDEPIDRYFKNRLGGLGQYYLGPLQDLGLLESAEKSFVQYTRERGGALAGAFNQGVNLNKFFDALAEDHVSVSTLKDLKAFCPCRLQDNAEEQRLLLDLFFNRPGVFFDEAEPYRRHTLALLLNLIAQTEALPDREEWEVSDEWLFRVCAYTSALPNGAPWEVSAALAPTRHGWMIYLRNELLSVAVQSIFWAALAELEQLHRLVADRQEFRDWFVETFAPEVLKSDRSETFAKAIERTRKHAAPLAAWTDERHEIQLAWRLVDEARTAQDNQGRARIVQMSIKVLCRLAARMEDETNPYGDFLDPAELTAYPINLFTFNQYINHSWPTLSMEEWLGWIVTEWGLDTHFRVSLRKLRSESKDTFRIRPTEEGLEVVEAPTPEFNTPRLAQAHHILCDLGALSVDPQSGQFLQTELGRALLEECYG